MGLFFFAAGGPHALLKHKDTVWHMAARRMHNSLHLGTADTTDWLLSKAAAPFLFIGDSVDAFLTHRVRIFDPERHHFNPLIGITPERAVDLADILYVADPGGDTTLTVRNGKQALAEMLLIAARLDKLAGDPKDPAQAEALRIVRGVLFFPTLQKILCTGRQFDFSGNVVVAIDRAKLGHKQSLILALLLIGQHKGQVLIKDGGFYLRPIHLSLIDQERLVCSVTYLSQLGREDDPLRQGVLGIKDKTGRGCTFKDAATLANFQGVMPNSDYFAYLVTELMA